MKPVRRGLAAVAFASVLFVLFAGHARADEPSSAGAAPATAAKGEEAGEAEPSGEINWATGFLGEKDGVEPGLLYRPKGMGPPFLANIINSAILFVILVGAGRKPVAEALKKRKARIVAGMEEAARMKAEAEKQLAEYEAKLANIDTEIERIRRDMRESADIERRRILTEAKERRERMERDARLLVEQELKAARESLMKETVIGAIRSAQELLATQLSAGDHDRIAQEHLQSFVRSPSTSIAPGGGS
jgi:F-type H+-transporting ATPase subunit b